MRHRLIVDPEAAQTVKTVFLLAEHGLGSVAIAKEMEVRHIMSPAAYKFQNGDKRYANYYSVNSGDSCKWSETTVSEILCNRVYIGELSALKTEVTNCKTKQRTVVPRSKQIITPHAHESIISVDQFERVQKIRATHPCPAKRQRYNIFRGILFCECCGHPLAISKKQLKGRVADMYLCMYHYSHPEVCPKTHRVYHDMLYPYVLQQVKAFAKSMKRRKVNSPISNFADIEELTPEILDAVIERIEISHVRYNSKPGSVIHIYWKLK